MTTARKMGTCILAALLSTFVCLSPTAMTALAEENDEPADTTTEATTPDEPEADEAQAAPEEAAEATIDVASFEDASADAVATSAVAANAAEASDAANTADVNADPFDVGNFMELRDVFKYEINSQSNQSFTINLTDDITLEAPVAKYRDEDAHQWVFTLDTHGKRYVTGTNALSVKNGNTVTILGHGHSLIYTDDTVNNITPGTVGGNLILGAADGSDTLTLNFVGTNHDLGSMVDANGGTVAIHSGVTLSNNVNATAYPGGGVDVSNGAVLNMDGGLIENCSNSNITWGGGVNVDGGTFNMTGGTIKGSSEAAANEYPGCGGGVALGAHGNASTFNMSGNAVITGNTAPNGGGVYVGPNSTFTMSDDASVTGNTGTTYGGGVYVAQGGTFTMSGNATVTGNSAPYGGGVINFGTATISNVYDNDAATAGADIYNNGTLTMEDVHEDWGLSREQATSDLNASSSTGTPTDTQPNLPGIKFMSLVAEPEVAMADEPTTSGATVGNPSNKTIDGWYYDGHRETGETDADGNAVVEHNRWNANESTADTPQYLQSYAVTGQPTTETMGLKAAHGASSTDETPETINVMWENYDGTVLFTLEKVAVDHVPAADRYNALSGHDNPTEDADGTYEYEFEGWDRTDEPNGDVVYTAEYDAIPEAHDATDTPEAHDTDPAPQPQTTPGDGGKDAPTTPAGVNSDNSSIVQTGDVAMAGALAAAGVALIALGALLGRRKGSEK